VAIVIAHRGASAYELENSLAAFRRAIEMGADGIELDAHDTRDGDLVVMHDPEIDGRRIGDMDVAEVRAQTLSNGEHVPTLAEALETIGRTTQVFIEVKTLRPAHDESIFALIDAAPAPDNCHVHAFDHRIVGRLCATRRSLKGGVLSSSYPLDPVRQIREAHAVTLWQHHDLIDEPMTAQVHRAGYALFAWTVDVPDRMRALLDIGIDAICTNKPDVGREVAG